jgi:deoxyhypusine synthase
MDVKGAVWKSASFFFTFPVSLSNFLYAMKKHDHSHTTEFGTGHSDGLEPVYPIDVIRRGGSASELLREYAHTAFGGRTLGEAADVLEQMIRDPECLVVCTVAGAMTVAKQGLLLCEMIERGWIHAVVATGALMTHGFVESSGRTHFKYDPRMNDVDLLRKGYDRVYDTLELEQNLDDVSHIVQEVLEALPEDVTMYSALIMRELGRYLEKTQPPGARGVLRSAFLHNVPVFVPAFTDCEMGLDVAVMNQTRLADGKKRRAYDPFLDVEHYARVVAGQKRCGIFTIGGGVPRNWAQQLGPFVDHMNKTTTRTGTAFRFHYGVRICPEPVHWGGLSGCTYSEGVSWGKFVPYNEGGRFSEVLTDATIAWPLLVRGLWERLGDAPVEKRLARPQDETRIIWQGTELL